MLWHLGRFAQWSLLGIALLGFAFMWWAWLHLGRLWSSSITRKAEHHIVDSGPYAILRLPIYTGFILAAAAATIRACTVTAVIGAIVLTLGFRIKARLEKRFLREERGAQAYDSYRRRVPMVLPFGPKSA